VGRDRGNETVPAYPSGDGSTGGVDGALPPRAARPVGWEGQAVAAVARAFGVGRETVMRAVRDEARTPFAEQQLHTRQIRPRLTLGVDEKVMNRPSTDVADAASP
jgi:hypothetical protein